MHLAARLTALGSLLAIALAACNTGSAPPAAAPAERGAAPAAAGATEAPGSAASAPARVEKVRVAETPAIAYAPVSGADARGYYREQGIQPRYDQGAGRADPAALLGRGHLHIDR